MASTWDKTAWKKTTLAGFAKNHSQKSQVNAALRGIGSAGGAITEQVLENLARADIRALYGISSEMTDTELAAHLRKLKAALNAVGSHAEVLKQLFDSLEQVKDPQGRKYIEDTAFWKAISQTSDLGNQEALDQLAAAIKASYPLGVITREQLRVAATGQGIAESVSDRDLANAVERQSVKVTEEFAKPTIPASAPTLTKYLHPSFRSPIDVVLLHERDSEPRDIRVIDELSAVIGASRRPITLADVRDAMSFVGPKPQGAFLSAKQTLNSVSAACANDDELRELMLSWYLNRASELVTEKRLLPLNVLLDPVHDTGLSSLDAKRIISSVESKSAGKSVADVQELIAAGDVSGARRLLDALGGGEASEEASTVDRALRASEAKRDAALADYSHALQSRNFAQAERALRDAQSLDRHDEHIAQKLAQLPPPPPARVHAQYSTDRDGVVITWGAHADTETRYSVVRSEDGVPANPMTGHKIVDRTAKAEAFDAAPLVGKKTTYAVFAFRSGADYSEPTADQIVVLPPPKDVRYNVSAQSIDLFWRMPHQASSVTVEIFDPQGSKHKYPTLSSDRLSVHKLVTGNRYSLSLSANYLIDGRNVASSPVQIQVTPRGEIEPVTDLSVASATFPDGRRALQASWTDVPGFGTELWALPIDAESISGTRLTRDNLQSLSGEQVTGTIGALGAQTSLLFAPLQDFRLIVPVTWAYDYAVIGTGVAAGDAQPPSAIVANRLGAELLLSWKWPEDYHLMAISWNGPSPGERIVERIEYDREGGVRIPNAAGVTQVSVATVTSIKGRLHTFTPVSTNLAVKPTINYSVRLPRGPFGSRTAEATFASDGFRGVVHLVAVAVAGHIMPARPERDHIVAELTINFSNHLTQQASFQLPKIKGPYWVRVFAAPGEDVRLKDPATETMKG